MTTKILNLPQTGAVIEDCRKVLKQWETEMDQSHLDRFQVHEGTWAGVVEPSCNKRFIATLNAFNDIRRLTAEAGVYAPSALHSIVSRFAGLTNYHNQMYLQTGGQDPARDDRFRREGLAAMVRWINRLPNENIEPPPVASAIVSNDADDGHNAEEAGLNLAQQVLDRMFESKY